MKLQCRWVLFTLIAMVLPLEMAFTQVSMSFQDQYDKRARRIEIHPIRPVKGISSGLVIAYGHPIPPPYVLVWRGGRLFVNNVQVMPSMIDEKWWQAHSSPVREENASPTDKAIVNVDSAVQKMARNGAPQESILKRLKSEPHIRDAEWYSKNSLKVTPDDGRQYVLELPPPGDVRHARRIGTEIDRPIVVGVRRPVGKLHEGNEEGAFS